MKRAIAIILITYLLFKVISGFENVFPAAFNLDKDQIEKREQESKHNREELALPVKEEHFNITSGFGKREDPFEEGKQFHAGIDIAKPGIKNTPVFSVAPAVVSDTGKDEKGAKYVVLNHGNGYKTVYVHLSKISVDTGDEVDFEDKIGRVGNTGRSTDPHLHFEIRHHSEPINPEKHY